MNKDITPTCELGLITPEFADYCLKNLNGRNRPLTQKVIEDYAASILAGRWHITDAGIAFGSDGMLLNGQHRLHAVVRAKTSIRIWIFRDLDPSSFPFFDIGKKRGGSDVLGILGEVNTKHLSSILVLIDRYKNNGLTGAKSYRTDEFEGLIEKYPNARESVKLAPHATGLLPPSVLSACYFIFSELDPVKAEAFVSAIVHGDALERENPWRLLRERLIQNRVSKAKLSKVYLLALTIKTWNAVRSGKAVKALKFTELGNKEAFPVAI